MALSTTMNLIGLSFLSSSLCSYNSMMTMLYAWEFGLFLPRNSYLYISKTIITDSRARQDADSPLLHTYRVRPKEESIH